MRWEGSRGCGTDISRAVRTLRTLKSLRGPGGDKGAPTVSPVRVQRLRGADDGMRGPSSAPHAAAPGPRLAHQEGSDCSDWPCASERADARKRGRIGAESHRCCDWAITPVTLVASRHPFRCSTVVWAFGFCFILDWAAFKEYHRPCTDTHVRQTESPPRIPSKSQTKKEKPEICSDYITPLSLYYVRRLVPGGYGYTRWWLSRRILIIILARHNGRLDGKTKNNFHPRNSIFRTTRVTSTAPLTSKPVNSVIGQPEVNLKVWMALH